jgi:hypothetical protein
MAGRLRPYGAVRRGGRAGRLRLSYGAVRRFACGYLTGGTAGRLRLFDGRSAGSPELSYGQYGRSPEVALRGGTAGRRRRSYGAVRQASRGCLTRWYGGSPEVAL